MLNAKATKVIPLLVILFLILLPAGGFFLGTNYQKNINIGESGSQVKANPKKALSDKYLIASGSAEYATAKATAIKNLKGKLLEIYSGKVSLKHGNFDKVDSYNWSTSIPYLQILFPVNAVNDFEVVENGFTISVSVYKYLPGQKVDAGYEGTTWIIDMDKIVRFLTSTTASTKKAVVFDMGFPHESEQPIEVRSWEIKKYIVYDSGFMPSGTISRAYVSYNSARREIINIDLSMWNRLDPYRMGDIAPDYSRLRTYTSLAGDFVSSVEDSIGSTVSQL